MRRPLYDVLGVDPDASTDELRSAWKAAARRDHPDLNPDDAAAAARFREVRAAWAVLSDPERRGWYDEFGEPATSAFFDPELARVEQAPRQAAGADWRAQAADPEVGARRRYAVTRGDDVEASLHLLPEEAHQGGVVELVVEPPRSCPSCGGSGWREGGRACAKCEGGTIPGLGPWKVMVPPGMCDGQRLRIGGEGRKGRGHGAEPGDLWVTCRVPPDYTVDGADVRLEVPVPERVRTSGGKVRVPLPEGGAVRVTVPQGLRPGQKLRLRGKGRRGGDLHVVLVDLPPERDVQAVRVNVGRP